MPDTTPATGLHTPITNTAHTESSVSGPVVSDGSAGFGDEEELADNALVETVPLIGGGMEFAPEFTVPDLSDLPDIGVASFGEPSRFEAVIGTDERKRIRETKKYPWRISASLLITAADNSQWIGTGWFISPRTLVTAGHCVYINHSGVPGRDGWVKKIQVMPGRDELNLPFGGLSATEFWTVKGWGDEGLENYDYGAIILPAAFPDDIGFYGFGVFDDETLLAATANVAGYPGDKPRGTLWYDNRNVGSVSADKVYYAADTAGGQSGACVYIVQDKKRIGIAIHTYGGVTSNSGTRISSQVYANFQSWKRT